MKGENRSDLSQESNWKVLNLPEFMHLEWADHEDPKNLAMREVVFHVPSGSMIEIFENNPKTNPIAAGKLVFRFGYINPLGDKTSYWAVLLRCPGHDWTQEKEALIKELARPACQWLGAETDFT